MQDEQRILLSLKRWGAPLLVRGSSKRCLPLESTIARGLGLARSNATVALVLPIVLAKHRDSLDLFRLKALANRHGQRRTLGFFIALCARLMNDRRLAREAALLQDRRFRKMQDFFIVGQGPRSRRLAELRTPPIARRWCFRMNMTMESFESTFLKFVDTSPVGPA